MKLSEFMKELRKIKKEYGDIETSICCDEGQNEEPCFAFEVNDEEGPVKGLLLCGQATIDAFQG